MTDAEELKFVGLWLIDISQSMRDLSAAVLQFCEKLRRAPELARDAATGNMSLGERKERWAAMMKVLGRNDIKAWRESFVRALSAAADMRR